LIIDDTWTTGSRAQSLAHALKMAGASSVAVVVLGRHVRPEHLASGPLLKAIEEPMFDLSVCAVER
jgi:orotate phosphoribosyltransferase-like protein